MNQNPGPLDALAGLLDERRRYEGWLAQLESRRASTPLHVFERVSGDYQQRLQGVMDQLRSRAADLESSARSLEERVSVLVRDETARRDERAEAELRAAVGEYTPEQANDLLVRADGAIGQLTGERAVVSAELAKVQEILAMVAQPAAPPPAPPAPLPVAAAAPPAAPSEPPAAGTDAAAAFDELAFLQSVVQPKEAQNASVGGDYLPPPSLSPGRRQAPGEQPMPPMQPMQPVTGGRVAAATPDGMAAFLKDMPTEQVKSLKCQECGTMNYPTEWYCERCGGELAAM